MAIITTQISRNQPTKEFGAVATRGGAVTPDTYFPNGESSKWIYVGGTGDVNIEFESGETLTFTAVPAGRFLPVKARRVLSSGTTATNLSWGGGTS